MANIIIIGSGLAGYTLAREIRKHDKESKLTIITDDDGQFYSKPLLSNALSKNLTEDKLATFSAEKMSAQVDAEICHQALVSTINPQLKTITLASTDELAYDQLVLAVGAHQRVPPLAGDAAEKTLSVNNLIDFAKFRTAVSNAKKVAIIGAGLIGCEFANDLINVGKQVSVINLGPAPLDRLAPMEIGLALQEKLNKLGVIWHCNTTTERVDHDNNGYKLTLASGEKETADIVLTATGLGANTELAATAGLTLNRGIVVDSYMATSEKDIYALGDCAELDGNVLPYVMPLMTQARALAQTLTGTPTTVNYPVMPVVVKTPAYPITIVPPKHNEGTWNIDATDEGISARYNDKNNALIGFALSGAAVAERNKFTKMLA